MTDDTRGLDDDRDVVSERRHLLNVGYRLLGSLTEAEDAVQETYSRWYALPPEQQHAIESPAAWLTLLVVLEAMTPAERVAFILHDIFHYSFAEIGQIGGRSAVACRRLAWSAGRRVDGSSSLETPAAEQALLVAAFRRAWQAQDVSALVEVLDPTPPSSLMATALRTLSASDHRGSPLGPIPHGVGTQGRRARLTCRRAHRQRRARTRRPDRRRDSPGPRLRCPGRPHPQPLGCGQAQEARARWNSTARSSTSRASSRDHAES